MGIYIAFLVNRAHANLTRLLEYLSTVQAALATSLSIIYTTHLHIRWITNIQLVFISCKNVGRRKSPKVTKKKRLAECFCKEDPLPSKMFLPLRSMSVGPRRISSLCGNNRSNFLNSAPCLFPGWLRSQFTVSGS